MIWSSGTLAPQLPVDLPEKTVPELVRVRILGTGSYYNIIVLNITGQLVRVRVRYNYICCDFLLMLKALILISLNLSIWTL